MSEVKAGLGFGTGTKSTTQDNKQKETEIKQVAEVEQPKVEVDETLEQPYTDERSISIALVKNYSLYRKVNDKSLPKRRDFIGSSVESSRTLASNPEELKAYFPNIVGTASNDASFMTRVKQYLNNIKVAVDELGITFNTSFHYYKKKDYLAIKAEEDKIEAEYTAANRQDIVKLKEALQNKIYRLNLLESKKCLLGYPIKVEEYLMYRHCLLYRDVAKDTALINADPSIRFYFKDDKKEAEKLRRFRDAVNKAKANYVACLANDKLFESVYIQYCVTNSLPIISSLNKQRIEQEIELDKFSNAEPIKFNAIYNNKDVKLMSNIELLIARGELIRSQFNQNITTADGGFIGANMKEAVAWFNNPENASIVNAYWNKLNYM